MVKKVLFFGLVVFVCMGGIRIKVQAQGEHTKPFVFLLPHQDDEMFLAGNIKKQLDAGQEVYVVVITDGGASKVRKILNNKKDCTTTSSPDKTTKIKLFLTRRSFSAARNKEFFASMKSLGVATDHILFANEGGVGGTNNPRYQDGKLTEAQAHEAIKKIYDKIGDGVYTTLAAEKTDAKGNKHAPHHDHQMLSNALADFSGISQKRFFSESATIQPIILSHKEFQSKHRALHQYFVCKPEKGRYAIGAHSVDYLFDEWTHKPVEYETLVQPSTTAQDI